MPFFLMFRLEQAGQVIISYCIFEILNCPFFQASFLLHDLFFHRRRKKQIDKITVYRQKDLLNKK